MIRIKEVHKTYTLGETKVNALRGVDLHIKKGEFVSIMGPSGSGKSTLLHLMGVLDTQTKGKIFIKGIDVAALSDEERNSFRLKEIGFIFQFYSLLPELTALENVMIPLMLYGKDSGKESAKESLVMLGLEERLNSYPHQLSGGEQQRVAIARAIVNRPEILLADEPTASLDSASAGNVINIFKQLNAGMKQTIVLITHEESFGKLAHRGIWLRDGLIEKEF
jgi:ABC-type lipoprotein export system ATPase subunit